MKYSIREFASEIRQTNPPFYEELSDSQVVKRWLNDHPEDKYKLIQERTPKQNSKVMNEENSESSSFGWLFFLILLSVLAFTKKKQKKHIEETSVALKETMYKLGAKNISNSLKGNENTGENMWEGIGLLFGEGIIEEIAPKLVGRKNFMFFSLTKLSLDGDDHIIGIGILGNVIILADFEKELKKALKQTKQQ